jgi:hypothetical protein
MFLKAQDCIANEGDAANLKSRNVDCVIVEAQQRAELFLIELLDALLTC